MTRAAGIDLSKHNGSFDPYSAVKPIDFVIQRLSWAMNPDEKITEIFRGVSQFERRLAYHYYSTGAPWKDQANLFLDMQVGKKFKCLIVDYEHLYNNLNRKTAEDLEKFLWYLVEQRPGKKVIGYSGTYVYRDFIAYYVDLSMFDWWMARYPWIPAPQTGKPKYPLGLTYVKRPWKKWQYSKTGKGSLYGCASRYVDLNVFNGTVEELETWLGMDEPEPEPVVPASKRAYVRKARKPSGK